jgi:hypothetical protein
VASALRSLRGGPRNERGVPGHVQGVPRLAPAGHPQAERPVKQRCDGSATAVEGPSATPHRARWHTTLVDATVAADDGPYAAYDKSQTVDMVKAMDEAWSGVRIRHLRKTAHLRDITQLSPAVVSRQRSRLHPPKRVGTKRLEAASRSFPLNGTPPHCSGPSPAAYHDGGAHLSPRSIQWRFSAGAMSAQSQGMIRSACMNRQRSKARLPENSSSGVRSFAESWGSTSPCFATGARLSRPSRYMRVQARRRSDPNSSPRRLQPARVSPPEDLSTAPGLAIELHRHGRPPWG